MTMFTHKWSRSELDSIIDERIQVHEKEKHKKVGIFFPIHEALDDSCFDKLRALRQKPVTKEALKFKEPPLGEVEIDNGETHFALVSDAYYAKTPHRILKLLRPGITEGEACALADYHFNKENSNE